MENRRKLKFGEIDLKIYQNFLKIEQKFSDLNALSYFLERRRRTKPASPRAQVILKSAKQAEEPTLHVELHRYACIADDYWARGK